MKFKYSQPHLFKQKQPVQIGPKTQKSNNISTPKPNEIQVRKARKYLLFSLSQFIKNHHITL